MNTVMPGSQKFVWSSLTNAEKSDSLKYADWWHLNDEQQFWGMKNALGIDASWSKERFDREIMYKLDELRAKVGPMTGLWKFYFGAFMYVDAQPARMLWVKLIPAEKRNEAEKKLFSFFNYENREGTDRHYFPFKTFNEAAKNDILKAAMLPSSRYVVEIPFNSVLHEKAWSKLSEEFQFLSFQRIFRIQDRRLDLALFKEIMVRDLPTMRATLKPTLDRFNLERNTEYPEFLFWVQHIPAAKRSMEEQQFLDIYGHGYFDGAPSIYWREAMHRREDAKIMRWLADIPVETSARVD